MFIDDLRKSILQKAVQGKLVEQNPNDEPASELLMRIGEEKEKLIKDGKIKKEKGLTPITDEEKPFDIPSSWKWVRLKEISTLYNGRAYKQNELLQAGKYKVLRVGNLFTSEKRYYSDLELEDNKYCDKGDIIYSWSASFGPHIRDGEKVIYHYHIRKIEHSEYLYRKYLYYFLYADTERIKNSGHGLSMIHVTKENMENRLFPLPPLEEQKRIVAKLDELMPLLDEARPLEEEITRLERDFPSRLRQSILQYAIQGKFVEQNSGDEPASELLKKIKEEKEKLIKDGKIKKEKPLEPITDEEKLFDIPSSWTWARFGSLCINHDNERKPVSKGDRISKEGTYNYYGATGAIDKVDDYIFDGEYLMIGEDGGNFYTIRDNSFIANGKFWANNHVHVTEPVLVDIKYLKHYLDSLNLPALGLIHGIAVPKLNQACLNGICVALPPLEEQKRIVAKLEELMKLCDELEEQIG